MPDYVGILEGAFVNLWAQSVVFLPKLIFAVVVFLLGLLVANLLRSTVVRVIRLFKIDELVERVELKNLFARAGVKLDVAAFLGWIVKWFVIIVALIAAADALDWDQVTIFLTSVVGYIPNVLIAVIILLVGIILANFTQGVVKGALDAAKMTSSQFLAGLSRWAIVVFSFMAALVQLGIAQELIQVLFTGFVAMIALAGGLAFGLGGREYASRILNQLSKDLTNKR
ncbi:hypothetical protein HON52_04705 [Candidatus Uhrbacteria bacterium]|jgi:hypothetical protein|nr:hypothetical protein [Candidatus Uhrbacteria bacterium]